tara:strand:- start:1765 stop:2097 length:333 start_codon:yes stop_codon:yes gene_type:complete
MAKQVDSTKFTDDSVLFASRSAANTWRESLSVATSTTAAEGVAKRCTHVADITTIDGVSVDTGASAADQTSIGAKDLSTDAGTREALIILAEKINYLTYRLEQAGLMENS